MKKYFLGILFFLSFSISVKIAAQPVGHYNGIEGKKGEELKQLLNEKISGHVDFSYNYVKNIINYSDSDPNNSGNVILFYLQQSRNADSYGSGGDYINREHVWAKSHGDFSGIRPMDSDAHNLRPADASVNQDRSNKDFDHIQPNGTQHNEATDCWFNSNAWEPGDATKGQVARILFYMAIRYEGNNEEMDLEIVDELNTYPNAEHGKLSTLLEWNRKYPPSDFERRRNERLFRIQQNRNPFIDHPEFADFIWANTEPSGPVFSNFQMNPKISYPDDQINLSLDIRYTSSIEEVTLFWGNEFNSEDNQVSMNKDGDNFSVSILPEGFNSEEMIYFSVQTPLADSTYSWNASYLFPEKIDSNSITTIQDVQGNGSESPLKNQEVTIAGRVTANFDQSFYLQTSGNTRCGINIYDSFFRGKVGDSLIVKGKVDEFNNLTELLDINYTYNLKDNKPIEPLIITTSDFNEDIEGMLVTIKGVSFADGGRVIPEENESYIFNDPHGSGVAFISYNSRLVGKHLPSHYADITGVLSQYRNTYQILPRSIDDIKILTGNNELANESPSILIYPNPVRNQLFMSSDKPISHLNIYNLSGLLVIKQTDNLNSIHVGNLKPGIYLVEAVFDNHESYRTKFLKVN